MNHKFLAQLTLLTVFISSPAWPAEIPDMSRFVGTFQGEAFNGNDLDPVTTILRLGSGGRLTGEYSLIDEGGMYEGFISNAYIEDNITLSVEWTDKDGEGYAVFQFASDFQSFTGYWSDYEDDTQHPWNGIKQ